MGLGDPDRIPADVRESLTAPSNGLYVSAISALEVATKERIGKLPASGLVEAWDERLADIGAVELAVGRRHAALAGSMLWKHRDPFDRVLVAQATIEGLTLVTVDRALAGLPVPTMLSW